MIERTRTHSASCFAQGREFERQGERSGYKQSGIGRESGRNEIDLYTQVKSL
jgi:acyl-CoA reductase-like NAD-dependent aldehyde dehydrogenase